MIDPLEERLDRMFVELTDPKGLAEAHLAIDIAMQFVALRERRGLTQQQLADRLGKTQQAISKVENPWHQGHNLARLKEAVAALDAYLDVTIVPLEDAEAYRALHLSKPVLDLREVPGEPLYDATNAGSSLRIRRRSASSDRPNRSLQAPESSRAPNVGTLALLAPADLWPLVLQGRSATP